MLPLALVSVLSFVATSAGADERADFLAAEAALKTGDLGRFELLVAGLKDYPLYPYLRFAQISQDPSGTADAAIEEFIATYPDSPLSDRLRRTYLRRLATAERWSDYARFYRPDDGVEPQCLYLRALMETGRGAEAMPQVEALWLSGHSRPIACDPVFARWREAGYLSTDLIWRRIGLALDGGETGLARRLGQLLQASEQDGLSQWQALERDPTRLLDPDAFPDAQPWHPAMLGFGVRRLARRAPEDAARALTRWRDRIARDPAAFEAAQGAVGRALTEAGDRRGLPLWDAVSATAANMPEQERRLRGAIRLRSWDWLAKWIARMPDVPAKRERWLYWQGRAEEQLGHDADARASFELASRQRSFWGFMAADHLGRPYDLTHRPLPANPERIRQMVQSPAYRRIRELHRLGREIDVRREWRAATRDLDIQGLLAAAYIADVFRWHDQAIFTLARAGYWDDLDLRFPLEYQDQVSEQAWQIGLDPAWIYGVLRQESVFAPRIASPAGAVGLMQLMPATAATVAADLGLDPPTRGDLYDPERNIALGSAYLARMRDHFGHPALATAAYNAGPSRVTEWLPSECTPVDLWIALIPFEETRSYVERVLTYRIIYTSRLGMEPTRLSDLLPPIPAFDFRSDGRRAIAINAGAP